MPLPPAPKSQAIFLSDEGGLCIWASKGCKDLLGYEQNQFLGLGWKSFLHPDDEGTVTTEIIRSRNANTDFHCRYRMFHQNGQWIEVIGHSEARRDEGGAQQFYVGILSEVNADLEGEALKQSRQIKANFLSTVNHELRTPLNGVLGMVGLLLNTQLDDNQRDFARIIQSSAEGLLGQINNILDYSKVDAGEMDIEPIAFDLRPTLLAFHEAYLVAFAEKGLELRITIEGSVPKRVMGDPGRIRQILEILIENALRFTETGHVLLCVNDAGTTSNHLSRIEFVVQDSGIGIESQRIRHLLEPFTQAEPTMTRKVGGLGLGLAIAKKLLGLMNSQLRIESVVKEGSRFSFTLGMNQAEQSVPIEQHSLDGRCILVIDAHDVDRRVTGEHFIHAGCQVLEASSFLDALPFLEKASGHTQVNMIVIDDDLQSQTAETFGRTLASNHLPFTAHLMVLASFGQKGDAHKLQMAGYRGFLVKPVDRDVLLDVARRVLAQKLDEPSLMITRHSLKDGDENLMNADDISGLRILIAEDNIVNQKVLRHFLSKHGCSVDTAGNGLEAVHLTEQFQYDLIFMDCRMPEMDGLEATRMIRERETAQGLTPIPIIGLTAHALSHSYHECISAGMNGYLTKPFKRELLWNEILRWFSKSVQS